MTADHGPVRTKDYRRQYEALWPELAPALERAFLDDAPILGRATNEFEAAFAAHVGSRHAIGTNSGTDALILSLRALGIGSGDEVITAANTFLATVAAIAAVGARPVLVEPDEASMSMDPERFAAAITPRTRAVIPVHLHGLPCPMAGICDHATRHGIEIVEDAAQAHGARAGALGRVGSIGRLGAFSFHPSKNLGAFGDAGAITTSDDALAERLRVLRNLGKVGKYEARALGVNSKLDTLQAVVLQLKLSRLDGWNARRRTLAARYDAALGGIADLRLPSDRDGAHVYHLYVVRTRRRDELATHLRERGIRTGMHYPIPPHLQPLDRDLGYRPGELPITERIAAASLSLPLSHEHTDAEIERAASAVLEFFA
ncbi:MAG: DegT/DnrJ/EryC1/StrS family aminotransferase [Planctomycetes bacterium]|nr:DegT/DnrJ/EryC1/StrS family aminotransferase [Planctomycetota bacterium]